LLQLHAVLFAADPAEWEELGAAKLRDRRWHHGPAL